MRGYFRMARRIRALADRLCGGKLIVMQARAGGGAPGG